MNYRSDAFSDSLQWQKLEGSVEQEEHLRQILKDYVG